MMKKLNIFTAAMIFCLVAAIGMSLCVGAATPREMLENGEVSDGPVTFGDARDGVVSDVSEEMSGIGGEISEFAESVLPGADSTDGINTTENVTSDNRNEPTTDRTEMTDNMNDTDNASGTDNTDGSNVKWGIVIAVIVVIAVVALIFFFIKRS